jgi:hypothetical protein
LEAWSRRSTIEIVKKKKKKKRGRGAALGIRNKRKENMGNGGAVRGTARVFFF